MAEITVKLAAPLADLFPGAPRRLCLEARDVNQMIDALDARWPGMGDRIRDTRPAIRRHMNVFVEGRRASLDTPIPAGADVYVITAISGG